MKIKMADVARYLGISKATVSLAVNGKPGVNGQTRQKILQCIELMEKNNGIIPKTDIVKQTRTLQVIKVVIINHRKQVVCDPELDLWSEVLRTFDTEIRRFGYLYSLTYLNEVETNIQEIIDECNMDLVAGVIVYGTEMCPDDYGIIRQIHKPLVIYDYEMPDGSYSSVCIDNAMAVSMSADILHNAGAQDIIYLSTGKNIYNFERRRESFQNKVIRDKGFFEKESMVQMGNTIAEITEQAAIYLSTHKLPDAFLFENYQVSIGVLSAIRRLGIQIPRDVKLIGIDEVPDYTAPGVKLVQIRIPHVERAVMAISILEREITESWNAKIRVFAVPGIVNGKSV